MFEENQEKLNCCKECKRVAINNSYFNKENKMCNYCYEVSINSAINCSYCDETKLTNLFERPKLLYCKECVYNERKT